MRSPGNPELWQKIDRYEFDRLGAALPFSARLARDNGWPVYLALQVIEQYKRFIYLLCISDELLTPIGAGGSGLAPPHGLHPRLLAALLPRHAGTRDPSSAHGGRTKRGGHVPQGLCAHAFPAQRRVRRNSAGRHLAGRNAALCSAGSTGRSSSCFREPDSCSPCGRRSSGRRGRCLPSPGCSSLEKLWRFWCSPPSFPLRS